MQRSGKALTVLLASILGVAVGIAVMSAWRSEAEIAPPPATQPATQPAADPPPPAPGGSTGVRFRLILPEGVASPRLVRAWWREPRGISEIRIGSIRGEYLTIFTPPGPGRVGFLIEGCAVVARMVDVVDGAVTDGGEVRLAVSTPLEGLVVDAKGAPIHRAFIYPKVGELSVPLTGTRQDGSFRFRGLPDGLARLRVECDGYVKQTVTHEHGPDAEPVRIVLSKGGKVTGRVVYASGEPEPDAYIWIVATEDPKNRERMAWPHLEDDATFEVSLAAGRYTLSGVEESLSGSVSFDVLDGGEIAVMLKLVE